MQHSDVVVIGGSAAGLTAAITAKRQYPGKEVILVRKEEKVLIPCGIPYIFGTVGKPENNLISDTVLEGNGIRLLISEVTGIDRSKREVYLSTGQSIGYERLILATGSLPNIPEIRGVKKKNIFPIYKDVDYLRGMQQTLHSVTRLVIVGGGFIGVEFAEECKKAGVQNVTIVEKEPACLMLSYDSEFWEEAHAILEGEGIEIRTSVSVQEFTGNDRVSGVVLQDGEHLEADAVILGIGARANTDVAKRAGLSIGKTGGIQVDRTMATNDPAVFSCGDCTEKISFFAGSPTPLKLASIATAEARVAGANLFEMRREHIGTIGVWSTIVSDTAFATAGLTETLAKQFRYAYITGFAKAPNRHPESMPGVKPMLVKLIFEKNSLRILGGQIMGDRATGELVNAVSACIQRKMTAEDIAMFQIGTHPALTASPISSQLVNAAEQAVSLSRFPR